MCNHAVLNKLHILQSRIVKHQDKKFVEVNSQWFVQCVLQVFHKQMVKHHNVHRLRKITMFTDHGIRSRYTKIILTVSRLRSDGLAKWLRSNWDMTWLDGPFLSVKFGLEHRGFLSVPKINGLSNIEHVCVQKYCLTNYIWWYSSCIMCHDSWPYFHSAHPPAPGPIPPGPPVKAAGSGKGFAQQVATQVIVEQGAQPLPCCRMWNRCQLIWGFIDFFLRVEAVGGGW